MVTLFRAILASEISFKSVESISSTFGKFQRQKSASKVEDSMDVKSAAKRELERDYAALFDVDDDELSLATKQDEDEDAWA